MIHILPARDTLLLRIGEGGFGVRAAGFGTVSSHSPFWLISQTNMGGWKRDGSHASQDWTFGCSWITSNHRKKNRSLGQATQWKIRDYYRDLSPPQHPGSSCFSNCGLCWERGTRAGRRGAVCVLFTDGQTLSKFPWGCHDANIQPDKIFPDWIPVNMC